MAKRKPHGKGKGGAKMTPRRGHQIPTAGSPGMSPLRPLRVLSFDSPH